MGRVVLWLNRGEIVSFRCIFLCQLGFLVAFMASSILSIKILLCVNSKLMAVFYACFQAYVILGVFLALNKDKDDFAEWLKKAAATNSSETKTCYKALKQWSEKFIWLSDPLYIFSFTLQFAFPLNVYLSWVIMDTMDIYDKWNPVQLFFSVMDDDISKTSCDLYKTTTVFHMQMKNTV